MAVALLTLPARSEEGDSEGWTIDRILSAVAAREAHLRGLDVVGSVTKRNVDLADYDRAMNSYRRALGRFYGYASKEEAPRTRIQLPPEGFRYRWRSPIELRFDKLTSASRDSATVSSLCYYGNAWNHFTDAAWEGPDRIIDGSASAPVTAEYLGVGGRINRIEHEFYDRADSFPMSLSQGLAALSKEAGQVSTELVPAKEGSRTTVSVTFLTPHKRPPGKQYPYEVHYRTIVTFAPDLGMAPTALTLATMVRRGDGLVQSPQGLEVSVEWSDFKRLENGQHVAANVTVTRKDSVILPARAAGFTVLEREGSPLLIGGEKVADVFDAKVERYVLEERVVELVDIALSDDKTPLNEQPMLNGAVVEDRVLGFSYQLPGEDNP